ncbi:MAG: acetophenone carboxylase [Actinomycetota bacterium]|nr:acetophenone carboxylase [Actinomycetota bacterium]
MSHYIAIDTGGTFTDGYVTGPAGMAWTKVDTTPHDLSVGVLTCIEQAADVLGVDLRRLLRETGVIRVSTTVGTNTLINRDGAKVGLLVGSDLYKALLSGLPERLPVDRDLVRPVRPGTPGEIRHEVIEAVHALLEGGARIVVIALDSGPDLAERELALRDLVAAEYPRHYLGAVPMLSSHQVSLASDPKVRAYTAVLDGYLHPVMVRFFYRLEDELRSRGYRHPLLLATADGGTSRVAKTTAIRTWGSGPVGGVSGAAAFAARLGLDNVVTFDVGGTSTDIGLVAGGGVKRTAQLNLEGVTVAVPIISVESVGVGGGSIVSVVDGAVQVGPQSAGAQPGPAAFGLGGADATVTDAACCLGLFDVENFLGGRKALDADAAVEVVAAKVAEPLGVSLTEAAALVLDVAADNIAGALSQRLSAGGVDPGRCHLFAVGGAGGLFAEAVGRRLGAISSVAFPLSPVFSAFGLSNLPVAHSYETAAGDENETSSRLARLKHRALADMRGEGLDTAAVTFALEGEVAGESRTSLVDLGDMTDLDAAAKAVAGSQPLSLVRLRATMVTPTTDPPAAIPAGEEMKPSSREVSFGGEPTGVSVFEWRSLPAGAVIGGPAVIESDDTTVVVPPGAEVSIGTWGEAVFRFRREA